MNTAAEVLARRVWRDLTATEWRELRAVATGDNTPSTTQRARTWRKLRRLKLIEEFPELRLTPSGRAVCDAGASIERART